MSRKHRRSKADRQLVTRRYVRNVVQRARDEIIRTVIVATAEEPQAKVWQRSYPAASTLSKEN